MKPQGSQQRRRRNTQFHFDARWLQSAGCQVAIEEAWGTGWMAMLIKFYGRKSKNAELGYSNGNGQSLINPSRIGDSWRSDYETREMLRWQQRSKEHWLANGDGNTKFFHSRASARKRHNTISCLKDSEGRWQDTEEGIQEILLQHYRSVFAFAHPSDASIDEVVLAIPRRVTPEMNAQLRQPFTTTEVKQALFGMFPFKSPGPDGMSPIFFQKFWNTVGTDVNNSVLRILNEHALLYKMNYTHVVLIPKCDNPELVSQLRPISLCNVVLKIASKCIANRLKTFELNHFLKVSTRIKKGFAALKLDMSKAYDRVEWSFLRRVLLRLGFESEFVGLIMLLVTTVSYSLTLNGAPFGYFRPEQGIRQGDPLSPYLFIFCAEAFSCLIQQAELQGTLQGIRVSPEAPSVSHLLFADDTLLFCEATKMQVGTIRSILDLYARASGQEVNFSKSCMSISGTISQEEERRLAGRLGVRLVVSHDRYLGLPAVAGRSRKALFQNIRDYFFTRINGWNSKLLSQAEAIKRVHWVAWRKMCRPIVEGGMGFRVLKAFNIALLAKQGWRVVSNPTSLLSRVLKAKYFPGCSFWDALVGRRPSLTWRSILLARGVLEVGCEHHALPNNPGRETGVWKPSKKGLFSVRSAYKVAVDLDARGIASSSRSYPMAEGCATFWQRVWAFVVPPRVRVQVWRFCHEAIPSMDNLAKRHQGVDTICVFCKEAETIKHVLWECHFATMNQNKKRMEGLDQEPLKVVRNALNLLFQYQDVRNKIKLGIYS
ncbi:UNVERIFIED_CONTAM: putative mitochondrial protein [Sesamum latifolium]|uniref:Mitochondrial protein n=1 Tax=Sesamum latifolium TaxID=2727402 RepID=A0AAW2UK49_9LAMI